MKPISDRQQKILDFIEVFQKEKGYPPSVREIGEAVGLASGSTVHGHLARLEKKGLIRRDPSKPRTLEIMTDTGGSKERYINFYLGTQRNFVMPESLIRKGIVVAAVPDDGMELIGIKKNDTVLVQLGPAQDGEIAYVSMRRPARDMVRRVYENGGLMSLETESATERDMLTADTEVLGKVVGVIHWFDESISCVKQ